MATEITSLSVRIGADIRGYTRGMAQVQRGVKQAEQSFAGLGRTIGRTTALVGGLAAAFASLKLVGVAKGAALASARFATLGVVMEQVGRNAGYTSRELGEYDRALRRTGISMTGSRQSIAQMIQAQVDLSESTKLARVAQDAAVIGNTNSTEAFGRLTTGIANANVLMLRTIGLNVNFERGYSELAKTLGKTTAELTDQERTQARVNEVLKAGAGIAGAYEASMDSAGKVIGSMPRQVDDLKVRLGALFDETVRRGAFGLYNALSSINSALERMGDARIQSIAKRIADGVGMATNAVLALSAVFAGRLLISLGKATAATLAKAKASMVAARASAAQARASLAAAQAARVEASVMAFDARGRIALSAATGVVEARQIALTRALARTTIGARAATVAMTGLRGALALLGGWPGIIVTGLGLIAFKLLEVRREAKRTADEIKQAISSSTAMFAELDKAATLRRLGIARKEVHALEKAVADLNAQAEREANMLSPTGQGRRGVATQETQQALASATRALEVARGEAEALEKQYIRLAQTGEESFDNTRPALALTSENFAALRDRLREAEEELRKLEVDRALAPAGEALDRVNKAFAETEARIKRIRAELSRYPSDISGISVPMSGVGTSIQQGLRNSLLGSTVIHPTRGRMVGVGAATMQAHELGALGNADRIVAAFQQAGVEFKDIPKDIRDNLERVYSKQRRVEQSYAGLRGGGKSMGAGDIGAALSGIGGMMGGRAGGAASGVGSAVMAVVSATNPLTAALGVAGGAFSALTSIFDGGASKIERVRESFARLIGFLSSKFSLLDTPAQQQFEELQAALAKRLQDGPLRDLLLGSSMGNTQEFITATVKALEAIRDLPKITREIVMNSMFGGLSEEQVMEFLESLKRLTDATNDAVSSMLGVPRGFKVALARFNATAAQMQVSSITGPTDTGGWVPGATTNSVTIEKVEIRAAEGVDVAKLWRDLQREIQRQAARGGATLGLAT